ncbi:dienelactone hydrolase family protein [Candidatus Leptofilum sp.]|uniref:dienelactone hydrolase family protein n=1 Tax=Candidatus Leptofilum sp. TaxID=3241576 RepID=UPI003B5AF611
MNRVELMELVRDYQVGGVSRRQFLLRATAALGSVVAANTLLAACTANPNDNPPPVVDESQSAATASETAVAVSDGELVSGTVTYSGPNGEELMGYWAYQSGNEPRPAVIVIQEWWGLNDHIKDVARRVAAEGYVALAPDLYHGVVTTEPDEARKQAMALVRDEAVAEIQAAIDFLKGQDVVSGRFGITGFCMGGGLTLQTAANSNDIHAAVPFYGSPLSANEAANVTAPVLSFLGTRDGISASDHEAMHAALSEAGVTNKFQLYDGAQHAFFNDTRASYDPEAASDAWQQMLIWFETNL